MWDVDLFCVAGLIYGFFVLVYGCLVAGLWLVVWVDVCVFDCFVCGWLAVCLVVGCWVVDCLVVWLLFFCFCCLVAGWMLIVGLFCGLCLFVCWLCF